MKALITGASSGIGRDMAKILSDMGYELVLVARRKERLEQLKDELKTECEIIACDLSFYENCFDIYNKVKNDDVEILINCAGFGVFGDFADTDLSREIEMINTNITSLHILTKLFLNKFIEHNKGFILNVASTAAFAPGPKMAAYYATKAYVLRLSEAIYEEIRETNVKICTLCPGPVDTEFNSVANVGFTIGSLKSDYVAEYAIKNMFRGKRVIVPDFKMKCARLGSKLVPSRITAKITHKFQVNKL